MIACPTPDKKRFATERAAADAGRRRQIAAGQILYPYPCACTWWHVSRSEPTPALPDTPPDPIDVERLKTIPDIAFRGIVADDATGRAALPDRLALRHPANRRRWQRILGELLIDLGKQRKETRSDQSLTAHDWRKRSESYEATLRVRAAECQQLRSDAHVAALKHAEAARADKEAHATADADRTAKQAAKAQQAANERIAKASQKELRRIAGEAAIKRLIDAHGPEWCQLLAEECDRIGAELPTRVTKYLRPQPTTAEMEHAA
ncbi:hypothetical protein OG369_43065 [Streptomyces sp. NBC_01221]|uniref:hypothetical protein n=1 Tax=Streptomyces sp. NBC_01221 TaxID=2903782 RepID=UPI00225A33EF|nr:hypothetical protein [Streptomyces sp. NBC_01221]MCX4792559.1 hypothetical protein [Streptomyces sp. NBC_01221]